MRIAIFKRRMLFQKVNWTPRALEVFATAKALASPDAIAEHHLLLALEAGDSVAAKVIKGLALRPSIALGQTPPNGLLPDGELYVEDFDPDLRRVFPRLAIEEAKSMGLKYFGTGCLLLLLSRIGVSGVELNHDSIRKALVDEVKESP